MALSVEAGDSGQGTTKDWRGKYLHWVSIEDVRRWGAQEGEEFRAVSGFGPQFGVRELGEEGHGGYEHGWEFWSSGGHGGFPVHSDAYHGIITYQWATEALLKDAVSQTEVLELMLQKIKNFGKFLGIVFVDFADDVMRSN
ncbi:hypothetical protein U1Q18_014801 [Sarracenia purpurea var. burkii]